MNNLNYLLGIMNLQLTMTDSRTASYSDSGALSYQVMGPRHFLIGIGSCKIRTHIFNYIAPSDSDVAFSLAQILKKGDKT